MSQQIIAKDAESCFAWEACRKKYFGISTFRGLISIAVFVLIWELGARFK